MRANQTPLRIRDPYAFSTSERDAIARSIARVYGVALASWYREWIAESESRGHWEDRLVLPHASKTQRRNVACAILMMMHTEIALHPNPRSFAHPQLLES